MLKTTLIAALAAVAIATDASSIEIIKKICPKSKSCDAANKECATAEQVTQPLIDSFVKYKITTPGEQASLIAWMALESVEFQFNHNHYAPDLPNPSEGRPGQGTRAMLMPNFVAELAKSLKVDSTDPKKLLEDVLAKGGDYEAAAWYYSTKCSDDIKKGVQAGTTAGHKAFIEKCVSTTWAAEREKYWKDSAAAFGIKL